MDRRPLLLSGPRWPCGEARPKSLKISDEDVVVHNKRAYNRGQVTLSNGREVSLKFENLPERRYRDQDAANGSHWYLGVHCACLDVAERLMNESSGKARSIGELWMTIERRRVKTADDENIRPLYLPSIPKNRSEESKELGLQRYYIPRDAIRT
ncbi:hypothetical protein BFJ69_g7054 [Fusarium oxysporum]|uniref:Uncharacterized protein n=1 Tax=Fusarium oxysporum TaxID=5507 RepID=A0A420N801_FUSOX|nr:hypothetical protein BFJ69_g7054 [Fusarium oxysporum]